MVINLLRNPDLTPQKGAVAQATMDSILCPLLEVKEKTYGDGSQLFPSSRFVGVCVRVRALSIQTIGWNYKLCATGLYSKGILASKARKVQGVWKISVQKIHHTHSLTSYISLPNVKSPSASFACLVKLEVHVKSTFRNAPIDALSTIGNQCYFVPLQIDQASSLNFLTHALYNPPEAPCTISEYAYPHPTLTHHTLKRNQTYPHPLQKKKKKIRNKNKQTRTKTKNQIPQQQQNQNENIYVFTRKKEVG